MAAVEEPQRTTHLHFAQHLDAFDPFADFFLVHVRDEKHAELAGRQFLVAIEIILLKVKSPNDAVKEE